MKAVFGLLAVGIIFAMMGGIMQSLDSSTSTSRTDTFGVSSNASTTTLTLQESAFQDLTASITLITSNLTSDHPIAQAVSGKTLIVSGLDTGTENRSLSVNYKYDSMGAYNGGSTLPRMAPLIMWFGIILCIVAIGVGAFKFGKHN